MMQVSFCAESYKTHCNIKLNLINLKNILYSFSLLCRTHGRTDDPGADTDMQSDVVECSLGILFARKLVLRHYEQEK